jgi:hypothetical protein
MVKSVPALVDGTAGFVERFFEENSEYHSLMPGVETAALPEGIDSDTGENVIDVAATATSVLNPSLMDVDF